MTTENDIIDCGGIYEVHPMAEGNGYAVVNGQTGSVHSEHPTQRDAVGVAKALNASDDDEE
jgi:hypothetical protein